MSGALGSYNPKDATEMHQFSSKGDGKKYLVTQKHNHTKTTESPRLELSPIR